MRSEARKKMDWLKNSLKKREDCVALLLALAAPSRTESVFFEYSKSCKLEFLPNGNVRYLTLTGENIEPIPKEPSEFVLGTYGAIVLSQKLACYLSRIPRETLESFGGPKALASAMITTQMVGRYSSRSCDAFIDSLERRANRELSYLIFWIPKDKLELIGGREALWHAFFLTLMAEEYSEFRGPQTGFEES